MERRMAAIGALVCLASLAGVAMAQQDKPDTAPRSSGVVPGQPGMMMGGMGSGSASAMGGSGGIAPRRSIFGSTPGIMPEKWTDEQLDELSWDDLIALFRMTPGDRGEQIQKIAQAAAKCIKEIAEAELSKLDQKELVRLWSLVKTDSDREKVQKALHESVKREFQARLQPQEEEVKALEAKVQQLRKQLDLRRSKQDEIVDFRTQQLLREAQGLGWGSENLPGRGRPGIMGGASSPTTAVPATQAGGAGSLGRAVLIPSPNVAPQEE